MEIQKTERETGSKAFGSESNEGLGREQLQEKIRYYQEREQHFAHVLGIADGGQYRADWAGHLEALMREVTAWRERFPRFRFRLMGDCIERLEP